MSLEIKYIDIPPGAKEDMSVTATGASSIASPQYLATGRNDVAWATLEPFGWPLDGSRALMPDKPTVAFWSEVTASNATGVLGLAQLGSFVLGKAAINAPFETPPVITLLFSQKYTATGITFTFNPSTEEWCSEVCVRWYGGQSLLAEMTAYPDAARWTLEQAVESFDQVQIELVRTNKAGHFAKVQCIEIGQTIWFGKDEISRVHLVNEIDPTLSELTVDTMTLEIRDKVGRLLFPQENQKLELYRNGNLLASHYIEKSGHEVKRHYTFSCQSAIGLLEDDFLGGIYNNVPVNKVLDDVLEGWTYQLNPIFADATLTGYLPVCTRREALQQVAFVLGAIVMTQGSESIQLLPIPENVAQTFTTNRIFQGAKVETAARIAKVDVTAHSYKPSVEQETLLEEEEISGENILLTFDAPHHSYQITGGTLTGTGANWVTITADGAVTLTAGKYVHSMALYTKRNTSATAVERNNIFAVEEVGLIHTENVQAVLTRLYEAAQLRQALSQEAVITGQRAGQKVNSENPWGGQIQGYITSMESDLTVNGHTAAVKILGAEVPIESAEFYAGDLYAGEEEVLY